MTESGRARNTGATNALSPADGLFGGPGEMRLLCRERDWAATPFGPVAHWPVSLRVTVATMLASRHPMFLFWGPDLAQIFNDAYRPSFGEGGRHLRALGARGQAFWTEIWHIIGPQIAQIIAGGEATWHEDQLVPIERNGRIENVWWTYGYSPAFDDDGQVSGVLVVCQETTRRVLDSQEREQLLAKTAVAEQRMTRLLAQISDAHVTMDKDFQILFINDTAQRVMGWSRDELIGKSHWTVFPHSVGTPLETHYRRVVAEGVEAHFIHHIVREGVDRYLEIDAYPTDGGGIALFWRDVSQRVFAEAARERLMHELEVERERLADVFHKAPAFLAVLRGPLHIFELANEAYYQLVGRRDLIGKALLKALPEMEGQEFIALLTNVVTTGEQFVGREVSIRLARTAGEPTEERFVDFTYLPHVDADGNRVGVIAHGTDVTEQVRARREVERLLALEHDARIAVEDACRTAESANRAKSEFLAVMSHELRTPLNAIGGYVELLEMGIRGPVTPGQRDDLHRIQTSQRHLLGLINEVLNYAKLETGSVHYDIEDVPVCEVLNAAESLVSPQARAKTLTLVIAECPPSLCVRADSEKLRQIMVNLLSNAVKFTGAGGGIEVSATANEKQVTISVTDTGIGIMNSKLAAIFDPFVQVRSDLTRLHEGTGLGLAISRDLARGMHGNLTVESEIGMGSVFILSLPASDPPLSS